MTTAKRKRLCSSSLRNQILSVARVKDPFISSDIVYKLPDHKSRSRHLKQALKKMVAAEIVNVGLVSIGENRSTMNNAYSLLEKIKVPFE